MSGTMNITGDKESAPLRVGYPIADTIGGLTAAFAIAAALAKQDDKRGTFIDVSMLESVMCTMGFQISNYFNANQEPQRWVMRIFRVVHLGLLKLALDR